MPDEKDVTGGSEPGRRRGRPRSEEPHTTVSTWLPARAHDGLIKLAHQREMSVSELVRRVIIITLRSDEFPN